MATAKPSKRVNEEIRKFLSDNGKKGGLTTKRLVELGRQAAIDSGEDVEEEVMRDMSQERRRPATRSA